VTPALAGATLLFAALCGGCVVSFGSDGTSTSVGWHANGTLRSPEVLPVEGDGYLVAGPWRERQSQYGTDELVATMVRATRTVARRHGGVAAIGDLSRRNGGASAEHRSHQSGRDVDLFFYAQDSAGAPVLPGVAMLRYDRNGKAVRWSPAKGRAAPAAPVPPHAFDVRRNWTFIRALLTDPEVEVQWVFVQRDLAAKLLQQGAADGDDAALLARAAAIVRQPSDSEPHDDHMHIRIYCDPSDRGFGCDDRGPTRWWKKHWKYMSPPFGHAGIRGGAATSAMLGLLRSRVPVRSGRPKLAS
jgi:penicillin-insensitive murein DD-endopeptidase